MEIKSNFYLIKYLEENLEENLNENFYLMKLLKMELDKRIYYYGDNFKLPYENNLIKKEEILKRNIKNIIIYFYNIISQRKNGFKKNTIISNSYFTVNDELENLGYNLYNPPWSYFSLKKRRDFIYSYELFFYIDSIKNSIRNNDFKDLISDKFILDLKILEELLFNLFSNENIKASIFPTDLPFFERLSIKLLKEIGKPSFIFLHGLFGMYNLESDNTSDYLIVWGEQLKKNCIKNGFKKEKIIVSGHPYYKEFKLKSLKFSLENILIISKPMNGVPVGYNFLLPDRGNSIIYLYSIQKVLKKLGVNNVRLRLHPSENSNWYYRFIDKSFFILDLENLPDSLKKSTLVIGSASTVFIESIYYGINYLLFEPSIDNIDLTNLTLAPPYDGSDSNIPVAKTEQQLELFLREQVSVNPDCFHDYIKTPFDINFIKDLI